VDRRTKKRRSRLGVGWIGVALAAITLVAGSPAAAQWRYYSADPHATRYSPLAQIDKGNVAQLRVVWRHPYVDPKIIAANPDLTVSNRYMATPIFVDGVLFVTNGFGLAEALDPKTGRTLWTQQPLVEGPEGLPSLMISKGVAYWRDGNEARVLTVRQQYLFALDPKTGVPLEDFGDSGKVSLSTPDFRYKWAGVPFVVGDLVLVGSSMLEQDSAARKEGVPGDLRAFDVRTGKLRWRFQTIAEAGDAGTKTWQDDAWRYTGAGNIWSTVSADLDLGYVYVPTSSATNDMYGGHRLGNDLYASSIVCLDAKTGKRVWYFQVTHHDLFDYDLPAAPILVDITVDGRKVRALAQVTKQGYLYVLDRVTGKPVWPIEELPAPASTVPGEVAARTQPVPTKPPPFERQGITENDLIDFTPELHAEALAIMKRYVTGPVFTPPSVRVPGGNTSGAGRVSGVNGAAGHGSAGGTLGTIQLPGAGGGASWHGATFDPDTDRLYVASRTVPIAADVVPGDPKRTDLRYVAGTREILMGPRGLPLVKPPYGRITAYDLSRGTILWTVANGDGPRDHPAIASLHLPPLGDGVPSAVIATKTLLFATEADASTPRSPPGAGGTHFKALDKTTGRTLWSIDLGAGANGTPMTYMEEGKQYVVVAIGGKQHPAELVALALP
jgi:glucose dehydrogenase